MVFSRDDSSQQPFLDDGSPSVAWKESKTSSSLYAKQVFLFVGTALLSIAATAVVLLTVFKHEINYAQPPPSVISDQILECGTSAQEARERGCVFDIMHYSWTPAPCFNQTLSEEYWNGLVSNKIKFWSDPYKSHVLPYEEILAAKHEYSYTSWLLHLKHCQYLIHRQLQSLTYNGLVDNLSRNISHSEHCLQEIRSPPDVKTMLFTGIAYLKCAKGVGDIGPIFWNDPPRGQEGLQRLL